MSHKITCSFLHFNFPNLPLLVKGVEVKNCSVKYAVSLQIIALRKVAVSSVLIWVYRAVAFFFSQTTLQQQQNQNSQAAG